MAMEEKEKQENHKVKWGKLHEVLFY